MERLFKTARKRGRNGTRDAATILLAYSHGLRAADLCQLRWSQIVFRHGRMHVNCAKGGIGSASAARAGAQGLRPLRGRASMCVHH
jgi:integrase